MKFRSAILVLTFGCGAPLLSAQVLVDGPILLTGPNDAAKQVTGIPVSTAPADILSAGAVQAGVVRTSPAVTGNSWLIDLPAMGTAPAAGTHLVVRAPLAAEGPVNVVLNGTEPVPVRRGSVDLNGSDLVEGTMLSLVHDGSAYQVLNGRSDLRRECPAGMADVNGQFCIDITERGSADFFEAALACSAVDRRLCSWSEFHGACLRSGALGLVGMTNNWEWTNNSANEDNSVRIVGASNCVSAGNGLASGSVDRQFRCCFTR
ncbi:MAG: hypothetical protein KDC00_04645 [Flavobacteriales bacterium]|nr:hypothetical protein [Flavobacteriales bacterium]